MENDVIPYTWTPSGLELLANIQKEMIRWRGIADDMSTICNKPDCYFCQENRRLILPLTARFVEIQHLRVNAWQKWEDEYLTKNFKLISYSSMHIRLHRGPSALAQRAKLLHLGVKPKIKHSA